MKFLLWALILGALLLVNLRETTGEIAVGCTQKSVDIVISLDDSSSINNDEWAQQIIFAVKFVEKANVAFYSPRFAINTWANWGFTKHLELSTRAEADAVDILNNIDRVQTGTPTDAGFAAAREQFDSRGDERDRIMLLITDGEPTQSHTAPECIATKEINAGGCTYEVCVAAAISAAEAFHELGIAVFTIGIGSDSEGKDILDAMASSPASLFSKVVTDFNALAAIIDPLVESLCFYPSRLGALCVGANDPTSQKYIDVIGKNLVDMGSMQCELKLGWDGVPVIVDATYQGYHDSGDYTIFRCPVNLGAGSEDDRVYVEVTRDGESWSENSLSFTYRDDCGYTNTQAPTTAPTIPAESGASSGDCETGCIEVATGCSAKNMDIVLVVDDSGSIFQDQWDLQVQFVADFIRASDADFGDAQFSLVLFGLTDQERDIPAEIDNSLNAASIEHELARLSEYDLIQHLEAHQHNKGWTPMDLGFRNAKDVLTRDGSRTDSGRLVLLITDGDPTTCPTVWSGVEGRAEPGMCLEAAFAENGPLKDEGVLVMTVGVGLSPARQEDMKAFASQPASMFALPDVGDFEALGQALPQLIDAMCFYVEDVDDTVCEGGNFRVTGKNLIDMGQTKCSFQMRGEDDNGDPFEVLIGDGDYQQELLPDRPGFHEVICYLPQWLDDAGDSKWQEGTYIYVEVARDGRDYSINNQRVRYSATDCSSSDGATGAGGSVEFGGGPAESSPNDSDISGAKQTAPVTLAAVATVVLALDFQR